ncbi:beta-galactosidase [bacterium]|nr:beta-galactosidase [bacterium]
MKLGVCYYPEHWPEAQWAQDASAMAELGLTFVRIAEFAWSRIEPDPGRYDWGWLDQAVDTLGAAGLRIVMCTPTATPPKWLIDAHPDVLAVGVDGRPRRFGSRRHYCFSSRTYRAHSQQITRAVAERYGRHPAVAAWQTDNEYGCHDTVLSYSQSAAAAFRAWLSARYVSIDDLNRGWGNVFWSQEYRSFEQIDPPIGTVTEANPAHRLDYQRFASDEVASFNREQIGILRELSPDRDILHNFMGATLSFDHFKVGADLDAASWDSYPLGFLQQGAWPEDTKLRFMRQGHPDFTALHHDLYRACGRGRWWVMEQQPGPVNWAKWNPAPLPGMVRAWTLEAFAHGAEVVSYFRWRQAPFAQEQMHAGLHTPDGARAAAWDEAAAAVKALHALADKRAAGTCLDMRPAPVALVFDYAAHWMFDIQPQGADFDYLQLVLTFYGALRRLGLDVDMIPPGAPLTGRRLVVAPSLPVVEPSLASAFEAFEGSLVIGPRSGSKTSAFQIPDGLSPGPLRRLLPIRVAAVESLPPGWAEAGAHPVRRWLEHVEPNPNADLSVDARTAAGKPIWLNTGRVHYIAAWPDGDLLDAVLRRACGDVGLPVLDLPDHLRLRRRGDVRFALNYDAAPLDLAAHIPGIAEREFVIGDTRLGPAGVAAWIDP